LLGRQNPDGVGNVIVAAENRCWGWGFREPRGVRPFDAIKSITLNKVK
jgi:hypothetical protein